jgi:uncharacterized membrane protein
MAILAVGLILFLGLHLVPALPDLRAALVRHLGEARYKGAFSLLSLLGLSLVIGGYARSEPGARLFAPSPAAIAIAPYAMTLAFVLLAAANLRGHIRHSLKHPMLLGIVIWASIHLLANGDTRGTVLFGSFLGYAVLDLFSALKRHTGKHFAPGMRYDVIAVVAGTFAAIAVMALHRFLFGVVAVAWGG